MKNNFVKVYISGRTEKDWRRLYNLVALCDDVEVVERYRTMVETPEIIKKLLPDVVVLDIDLPQGQGIALLKQIVSMNPSAMIIVVSNHPSPQYRRLCEHAGAVIFFDKAKDFHQIPIVLKSFIHHKDAPLRASNYL